MPEWTMQKMTERDIPELVKIFTSEPCIPQGLELSRKDTRDLPRYFDNALDEACRGERVNFLMRSCRKGDVIGGVTFFQDEADSTRWERAFWIKRAYRGQGYAARLTSAAMAWMFDNGLAHSIQAMTRPSNDPSIYSKQHQGFVLETIQSSGAGLFRLDILHAHAFRSQTV